MGSSTDYIFGYVEGYWDGWEFSLGVSENEGGTAPGSADAPSSDSAPDPGPLPLRGPLPGSRAPSDSELPATRQGAAPVEGEGVDDAEAVQRGMVMGLHYAQEMLTNLGMVVAASVVSRTATGLAAGTFRRVTP